MSNVKSGKNLQVQDTILRIDGQLIKLKPKDIDGDGKADYNVAETVESNRFQDKGKRNIIQPTEMGESLEQLNLDEYDPETRMSGIDMRSRLHYLQVPAMATFDSLIAMRFLPISCSPITRGLKRLAVSLAGKGREEIVGIVGGNRDHEEKKGIGGFFGNLKDSFKKE